jgi:hypothetical protein
MDSEFLLGTLNTYGVAYVEDDYGEPVFGPPVSTEGVRILPVDNGKNIKALAAALTQLEGRLDPNQTPQPDSAIKGSALAAMLRNSWYMRFFTTGGKLELIYDYTHRAAEVVAPQLGPGERVIAAVPAERAGKQKNADLFMKIGAAPGNLLRRRKARSAAHESGFPDASAMVLVATTHRIATYEQATGSRFATDGVGMPGGYLGDIEYERVARVEAARGETVGGIQRAGYMAFAFRDGTSHVVSAWSGGGSLFATAANAMAGRTP